MQGLRQYADDAEFQSKWQAVKQEAKLKAVQRIRELTGIQVCTHMNACEDNHTAPHSCLASKHQDIDRLKPWLHQCRLQY